MVPFHGKPFMGYTVDMLREQGFERILMLLGYLPEVVMDHFGDGSAYGVEIEYDVLTAEDLTAYRERFSQLTLRENEILSLVCSGLQNKEIARELNISPKTVEFHRTNLLQKTRAGTSAHLVQIATRLKYEPGNTLG